MNNKHWQKSQTNNTAAARCGSFAVIGLVDPRVGIYTACLLFLPI